jgi:hypothetical protein
MTRRRRTAVRLHRGVPNHQLDRPRALPLVRRRIPVASKVQRPGHGGNDSLIAAIAEVIRDAIAADGEGSSSEEPSRSGRRMATFATSTNRHGDHRTRTPAA